MILLPPTVSAMVVPIRNFALTCSRLVGIDLDLAGAVKIDRAYMQGLMNITDQVGKDPEGLALVKVSSRRLWVGLAT